MLTGSLETFTSSEVLRLVAGTRRTGSLVVSGDGPLGTSIEVDVVVRDGKIVSARGGSPLATTTHTALADLLRIRHGEFSFDADTEDALAREDGAVAGSTLDVDAAIAEAESILTEWQALESYVPSLDAAVDLTASIDTPVTLTPSHWTTLAAIGAGCTARDLGRLTGQGPLDVCRSIRVLVDVGVVRVHDDHDRPAALAEVVELPAEPARTDSPMGPDSADLLPEPEFEVPVVPERFRHFSPRAALALAATEQPAARQSA